MPQDYPKRKKNQYRFSRQFQSLRWRLLGSYLAIMTAILVISDLLVYEFFARSLYQQFDESLVNLAQAAAHSLTALKEEPKAMDETRYNFDDDGDLDIPWQNLRQPSQSIEWFNNHKKRLAQAGKMTLDVPVQEGLQTVLQPSKQRVITIAVYSYPQGKKTLEGFIRVSESVEVVEALLKHLSWGCYLGGLTAVGLIGIGGMWLTRESFKPVEQSYQQLEQFTADASHELRSPLTAIKTSVEVIQTHPERIHPVDVDKFQAIVSATNQMSKLVEDLLWLARCDRSLGNLSQQFQVIPLAELLEDVSDFLELKAAAKDITLQFQALNPVAVRGEPSQLGRLFNNLLDNAIKYTLPGGVVTLSLQEMEKFAVVRITDTGIGIAKEHLPLIFNRFWRAETARSYQEGTGLGLAIAHAITQAHGGDISVTSTLGVGTCFEVSLPLEYS